MRTARRTAAAARAFHRSPRSPLLRTSLRGSRCARAALIALVFVFTLVGISRDASHAGGSSLSRLRDDLLAQLDGALRTLPDAGAGVDHGFYVRLGSSARALGPGRGEKLARALLELAAGRYSDGTVASIDLASGADIPGLDALPGRGVDVAVVIDVQLEENYVILEGDVISTDPSPWRPMPTSPPVLTKLFVRERLDAELRFYLGAIPAGASRGALRMDLYALDGTEVLDVTVADLDGDGTTELVLLERHRLRVLRWRAAATSGDSASPPAGTDTGAGRAPLERVAETNLDSLPRAPRPSREPVGTLLADTLGTDGATALLLRTSDLARAHLFTLSGSTLTHVSDHALWPLASAPSRVGSAPIIVSGELGEGSAAFARHLEKRFWPDGDATALAVRTSFVAFARREVSGAAGSRPVTAVVSTEGKLVVEDGDRAHTLATPVGFALDLGDLDDDGLADVAVASASAPGTTDEVLVLEAAEKGGSLSEVWRSGALAGEARVLAIGDVDHDGRHDVVAVLHTADGGLRLGVISKR